MKKSFLVENERHMRRIGRAIGQKIGGGEIIGISGPLGAGKTTLTKGILNGAGISRGYSPTFVVAAAHKVPKNKQGKKKIREIHHFDFYRMKNRKELLTSGIFDCAGLPHAAVIIEWADMFPELFKNDKINVNISILSEKQRFLEIEGTLPKHEKIISHITRHSS